MTDTVRLSILLAITAGTGFTVLLSGTRHFSRLSLDDRLRPHIRTTGARQKHSQSVLELVAARAHLVFERVASGLGLDGTMAQRLGRAGMDIDVHTYRMRQIAWVGAGLGLGLLFAVALRPAPMVGAIFILVPGVLGLLATEQIVASAAQARQERIRSELPIVAEQLAMLLSAGYSLTSALSRIGERNTGVTGTGLRTVCERIRYGFTAEDALRQWSETMAVDELDRLVDVLSMSSQTSDLGTLVSTEAHVVRLGAQRRLSEQIEKRAQQVWIPVTVATLIPGVIFLIIPFLEALSIFSGS